MKKKKPLHYGGFAGPLPCNGSEGGITTKRKNEVTCPKCKRIIRDKESQGFIAVSGEFRRPTLTPKTLLRELRKFINENPKLADRTMHIWVDESNGTRSVHVPLRRVGLFGSVEGEKPSVFGEFNIQKGADYS